MRSTSLSLKENRKACCLVELSWDLLPLSDSKNRLCAHSSQSGSTFLLWGKKIKNERWDKAIVTDQYFSIRSSHLFLKI